MRPRETRMGPGRASLVSVSARASRFHFLGDARNFQKPIFWVSFAVVPGKAYSQGCDRGSESGAFHGSSCHLLNPGLGMGDSGGP